MLHVLISVWGTINEYTCMLFLTMLKTFMHTALQLAGYEVHIHEISLPLTSNIQDSKTLEANESLEAATDQSSNLCELKTDTVRLDTR